MDPISAIVAALVAGATEAVRPTAAQAVKDAYNAFKALIVRKFAKSSTPIQGVEEKPTSEARQGALKEELTESGADRDAEVSSALQNLVATLRQHAPQSVAHLTATVSGGLSVQGGTFQGPVSIAGGNTTIQSGGGAVVQAAVNTGGGAFIGRDQVINNSSQGAITGGLRIEILGIVFGPRGTRTLYVDFEVSNTGPPTTLRNWVQRIVTDAHPNGLLMTPHDVQAGTLLNPHLGIHLPDNLDKKPVQTGEIRDGRITFVTMVGEMRDHIGGDRGTFELTAKDTAGQTIAASYSSAAIKQEPAVAQASPATGSGQEPLGISPPALQEGLNVSDMRFTFADLKTKTDGHSELTMRVFNGAGCVVEFSGLSGHIKFNAPNNRDPARMGDLPTPEFRPDTPRTVAQLKECYLIFTQRVPVAETDKLLAMLDANVPIHFYLNQLTIEVSAQGTPQKIERLPIWDGVTYIKGQGFGRIISGTGNLKAGG